MSAWLLQVSVYIYAQLCRPITEAEAWSSCARLGRPDDPFCFIDLMETSTWLYYVGFPAFWFTTLVLLPLLAWLLWYHGETEWYTVPGGYAVFLIGLWLKCRFGFE